MIISFGDISANWRREGKGWVWQMARYKTIRFFGYGNHRLFLGLILGSKTAVDEEEWTKRAAAIKEAEGKRERTQCPYCGTSKDHQHLVYSDTGYKLCHAVECDICQARGPTTPDSEKKAWELWHAMSPNPSAFLKRYFNAQ